MPGRSVAEEGAQRQAEVDGRGSDRVLLLEWWIVRGSMRSWRLCQAR